MYPHCHSEIDADLDGRRRNCNKTLLILAALAKRGRQIRYFALDVAMCSLTDCLMRLHRLTQKFDGITVGGLRGTYDDCIALLSQDSHVFDDQTITFLWQGNSIANLTREDAASLLSRLIYTSACAAEVLVAADGCQDVSIIKAAYDLPGGQSRTFVQSGLLHANRLMESNLFDIDDWGFEGVWDDGAHEHNTYHVAKRDLILQLGNERIAVAAGQRLHAVVSAKWNLSDINDIRARANLSMACRWTEEAFGYSMLTLRVLASRCLARY